MNWRVHLHPEVIRYLYGLREEGVALRAAIGVLRSGPPLDARETTRVGFYLWIEARHWIVFRVEVANRAVYVVAVDLIDESQP